ncbi:substrate-binding domain-containing protein [Candidatus Entotheonella palauensis]|uniref:substrate-binding domain-containing protein n=1 Tax=Candidatus Entotheonella palauensis TaxID=93172 RepID=UPI0015C48251|nr:substrate-binding domain-containing protein [Candidatus Entotheonella palauensis]
MIRHAWLVLMIALMFWSCSRSETEEGKLELTGSSTVAPLASDIAKRFESLHPNIRVNVQTGGSSRGIADARVGLADIGMVSRGLKDEEKDLNGYAIAADGIGMIVHHSNRLTSLTYQQVTYGSTIFRAV